MHKLVPALNYYMQPEIHDCDVLVVPHNYHGDEMGSYVMAGTLWHN